MVINIISVHYNGGLLPDVILLIQGYYHRGEASPLYPMKQYTITTMFDAVLHCFCFVFVCWCPCMAINVSVIQYNGGLLPDIILLTQCYYHRGTRLNATKRFCICSL